METQYAQGAVGFPEHFIALCHLVWLETPAQADPHGNWFCFERGVRKTGGGDGWTDVWHWRSFAREYKGKHKDLNTAFSQLQRYAIALENPSLLVVSDEELLTRLLAENLGRPTG